MGCNSIQPGSKFNHNLLMQQPEIINNCSSHPASSHKNMGFHDTDDDVLLADAGYNVKSADLVHVAQRLEQLESLFAAQDPATLCDAVHYNPSDMAGWIECMIGELAPSPLVGCEIDGTDGSMHDVNVFPQQTPMQFSSEDEYGAFNLGPSSSVQEPMDQHSSSQQLDMQSSYVNSTPKQSMIMDPSSESTSSISQFIRDAIGNHGASTSANGPRYPKEYPGMVLLHDAETGKLQPYKIIEDQASSNQMGSFYQGGVGNQLRAEGPFSSGFPNRFTGQQPTVLPKSNSIPSLQPQQHTTPMQQKQLHQQHGNHLQHMQHEVKPIVASASSQSSNGRAPYQDTPHAPHHQQQHQLRQQQAKHMPEKLLHSQLHAPQAGTFVNVNDEGAQESGIRLVHLLMACAEAIQNSQLAAALDMVTEIRSLASSNNGAMGKVANHFVEALAKRICGPSIEDWASLTQANAFSELLYSNFYEACPYLKFAHFTANQAILEAFEGHKFVHVIDLNLMQGLQWPALIQALALRPGGPPHLRMTGVGPPQPGNKDVLREIGMKLAELAGSVNVEFSFRGVVATKLDDVEPWMFEVKEGEAIAVNSILQLHRLLSSQINSNPSRPPIDVVLNSIKSLSPKVVTLVEQEANHNSSMFLERFVEALHYYCTMFDSLEASCLHPQCTEMACTEMYLAREIVNIVACEGLQRVERHEPLSQWRKRMLDAGFQPVHLGSNAYKQASVLLKLFSGEGYTVEENKGGLTLGWHSRPLIAASAWQCG
eukprot:c22877_g1_i1 orf=263-2560(+)